MQNTDVTIDGEMFYRDLRNFPQSVYLLYYLRSEETYSVYKFPNP